MIDRPLQTFSVAFKDRAFNELDTRAQVARAIDADAHEIVIDDDDFFGALPKLVWHEDEPIAHPSSVPLYFVSALARAARHGRADRRRQRRAARRLRQVPARRLELARRHRSTSGCCREPVRDSIAAALVPRLPRTLGRYAQPIVPGDGPRSPEAMFFDNFAVDPARRSAAAARAGAARSGDRRAQPTAPSLAYFDRAERHAARCSIGCSTPTSRRISSSC